MFIDTIPDMCLQYEPSLDLLRVAWVSGPDMRTFRPSAVALMSQASEWGVHRMLIDTRLVPDLSFSDEVWMSTHIMPALLRLPLKQLVLVVSSAKVHNQLVIETLFYLVEKFIRFDSQYFDEPEPGMHWLTDDDDQVPRLLAEWDARQG